MDSTKKTTKYNKLIYSKYSKFTFDQFTIKKIADAVKNNNGTTIRLSNKNFNKNQE